MAIKVNISTCDKCPHSTILKVYTPDPFENIRKIRCDLLNEDVHPYLDTWDKAPVPANCPIKEEEVKSKMRMTVELTEKEVETAIRYYLQNVEKLNVTSFQINVGQHYVGAGPNETLMAKFKSIRCEVEK